MSIGIGLNSYDEKFHSDERVVYINNEWKNTDPRKELGVGARFAIFDIINDLVIEGKIYKKDTISVMDGGTDIGRYDNWPKTWYWMLLPNIERTDEHDGTW